MKIHTRLGVEVCKNNRNFPKFPRNIYTVTRQRCCVRYGISSGASAKSMRLCVGLPLLRVVLSTDEGGGSELRYGGLRFAVEEALGPLARNLIG